MASVYDLLAVLELDSSSGDTELAEKLRRRFSIAPGADLSQALRTVPSAAGLQTAGRLATRHGMRTATLAGLAAGAAGTVVVGAGLRPPS